ncbi:hypothetical protein E6C70_07770 [Glaciibacter flavus]|uniref:Uncharacterized protein n=1 Tax=Orlajensenia flava TaxID=2565934 RepID=A0A4S4FX12_9MICO|nr:hypothetical protein [Glaciibacter flavus]THG34186.1 hypothetical protein E6C70_07770 [Glaciibacter flavus]
MARTHRTQLVLTTLLLGEFLLLVVGVTIAARRGASARPQPFSTTIVALLPRLPLATIPARRSPITTLIRLPVTITARRTRGRAITLLPRLPLTIPTRSRAIPTLVRLTVAITARRTRGRAIALLPRLPLTTITTGRTRGGAIALLPRLPLATVPTGRSPITTLIRLTVAITTRRTRRSGTITLLPRLPLPTITTGCGAIPTLIRLTVTVTARRTRRGGTIPLLPWLPLTIGTRPTTITTFVGLAVAIAARRTRGRPIALLPRLPLTIATRRAAAARRTGVALLVGLALGPLPARFARPAGVGSLLPGLSVVALSGTCRGEIAHGVHLLVSAVATRHYLPAGGSAVVLSGTQMR